MCYVKPVLYFVRHGETVWNRMQRLQGRADSPLTLRGVELAIAYARGLAAELEIQHVQGCDLNIYSSPMGRAVQTATLIADVLGMSTDQIESNELLAEHDVGSWSGRSWREIEAQGGPGREALRDWNLEPPRGESRSAVLERARSWLDAFGNSSTSIVVSHGGFSRCLRGAYLGLELDQILELSTHAHGLIYKLSDGCIDEIALDVGLQSQEDLLG